MTHFFQYQDNMWELTRFIREYKDPTWCLRHRYQPILYFIISPVEQQDHWGEIILKRGDFIIIKDNRFYKDLQYLPQVKIAEFDNVLANTFVL